MVTQTLSNIAGFLKRDYKAPIQDQLNNSTALFHRLEKNTDEVGGEDLTARISLFYKRNQGIGWRGSGGTLPTAGRRSHSFSTIAMAQLYGKIRIERTAIKASRSSEYGLAKVVINETKGMVQGLKIEVNRALIGRGTGAMAKFTAATTVAAGTSITVDDASRLEPGMVVDTWTTNAGSGGTAGLAGRTIDNVDYINNKVTFVEDLSGDGDQINDFLYRDDSRGFVMMGLEGIVDGQDSTGTRLIATLQGITRSTNWWWDAVVLDNGGTLTDIDNDTIQRLVELCEKIGQGETSALYTTYELRRKYIDINLADRRWVNQIKLDGGWSAVEYTGGAGPIPIIADRMMLKNQMFALDESSLEIYEAGELDWIDEDGAVFRKVSDVDEFEADAAWYLNLAAKKCSCNGVLRDRQ